MNDNQSTTKRKSKARERIAKRKERRQAMVSIRKEGQSKISDFIPRRIPSSLTDTLSVVLTVARDALWYLTRSTPVFKVIGGIFGVLALFFVLVTVFSNEIGPKISSLDIVLSGLSEEEAANELLAFWQDDLQIRIMHESSILAQVRPAEIGLYLDAPATAQAAKDAGLSGLPFGHEVEPIIEVDYAAAQDYFLTLSEHVYIPAYEAGYEWVDDQLIGVPGRASRELDIVLTIQNIVDNPIAVVNARRVELLTSSTSPVMIDPDLFLDDAERFVTSEFIITGFDPFMNEFQQWQTTRAEMASWLVATQTGLAIRTNGLDRFVETVNNLLANSEVPRYLNEDFVADAVEEALFNEEDNIIVRIYYLPGTYTIKRGDTGFSIGRGNGLPFQLVMDANPSLDLGEIYVGQEINLPSRDEVVPIDPVPGKRIIVDLERLWLVAYENNEMIFHWKISVGRDNAPTSPGIYQILEKERVATGSSFALCADTGCGEWKMDYFMSIYEVAPGLTNGFHGAVLLPNGYYLDGGSEQVRSTFGCVMSDDEQAAQLYNWAEIGTMVELVSDEFAPVSDVAFDALAFVDEQIEAENETETETET